MTTFGARFAFSFARARTLPFGVDSRTQSPAAIPRAPAVSGCTSTWGSGADLRRLATWRCWDSQKKRDLAQVRTSGNSVARSGRESGLMLGSVYVGTGGYPAAAKAREYSSTLP